MQNFEEGAKRLHHPKLGLIDLTYVALVPEGQPNLSFVTYALHPGSRD